MIQTYSKNTVVEASTAIPFNSTSLLKGCTTAKTGISNVTLEKSGIYMVSFDAAVVANDGGTISVQLNKNGVLMPEATTSETAADTTSIHSISFETLVQVGQSNSCSCSDSGTTISIINTGVAATYNQANLVITKIC